MDRAKIFHLNFFFFVMICGTCLRDGELWAGGVVVAVVVVAGRCVDQVAAAAPHRRPAPAMFVRGSGISDRLMYTGRPRNQRLGSGL